MNASKSATAGVLGKISPSGPTQEKSQVNISFSPLPSKLDPPSPMAKPPQAFPPAKGTIGHKFGAFHSRLGIGKTEEARAEKAEPAEDQEDGDGDTQLLQTTKRASNVSARPTLEDLADVVSKFNCSSIILSLG